MNSKHKLKKNKKIELKIKEECINITRDCLYEPVLLSLRNLCQQFIKIFMNHKEELSLEEVSMIAFSRDSEINFHAIQINVLFNFS